MTVQDPYAKLTLRLERQWAERISEILAEHILSIPPEKKHEYSDDIRAWAALSRAMRPYRPGPRRGG